MKFNKEFILKNLTGILCVIAIIAMFLPFISIETSASGGFGASVKSDPYSYNGFSLITEGSLFGILTALCIVIIIASTYVPQLKQYRKFVLAGSAVLGIICLIIVPSNIASTASAANNAASGIAKVDVDTNINLLVGFWIILLCYIAILAVAVIQFFGLKGNKVFDMVNSENSGETSANAPQLNLNADKLKEMVNADKLKEMAQNAAGSISGAASSVKDKVSNVVSSGGSEGGAVERKEDPKVIMERIKELHEMKEMGILTEEEFAEKKQEYLKKM